MSERKSWVCTNTDENVWLESLELSAVELGIDDARVSKRTLKGGRQNGVDLIEVDNGDLSFYILPTRGMGIWRGNYKGEYLGWRSPIKGPVNPAFVDLHDRGGLGFASGFDEWIVRCGLNSMGSPAEDVVIDNHGNPSTIQLTLHGKIANTPAHYVEIEAKPETETITVKGEVDEAAIFMPGIRLTTAIATQRQSGKFTITDTVTNIMGLETELELLYHCNYGAPFLEEGSRLEVPIREMAPRDAHATERLDVAPVYQAPTPGFVEDVFFYELAGNADNRTMSALINAAGDKAAVLRFDLSQLPYFTQWKNCAALVDGYVTAMEPCTAFPSRKPDERAAGRVIVLEAGEERKFELEVETHIGEVAVQEVVREIAEIQQKTPKTLHPGPIDKYPSS